MSTLRIGPTGLGPASERKVTFRLSESEAAKCGLADRWRTANQRWLKKQEELAELAARQSACEAQLKAAVVQLLSHAEAEQISQRELSRKAGFSWGSFRRCRDGQVKPATWLPKIQAALERLKWP